MNTIDLSYRPDTYWPASLTPEQLLTRIRGKQRQQIARQLYEESGFKALNQFLVREGLTEEERSAWSALGPWCMGGEYLPELEEGEVEIARISLSSVTSDQISVRARPDGERIRYRIVGEYEDMEGMQYQLPLETSSTPLSLGELMNFIAGSGIEGCAYPGGIFSSSWAMMLDSGEGPDRIAGFISVSSAFYPQIEACYDMLAEQWLEKNLVYDEEE